MSLSGYIRLMDPLNISEALTCKAGIKTHQQLTRQLVSIRTSHIPEGHLPGVDFGYKMMDGWLHSWLSPESDTEWMGPCPFLFFLAGDLKAGLEAIGTRVSSSIQDLQGNPPHPR